MKDLIASIWAEDLKVRRSKLLWISAIIFSMIPLGVGFLILVLRSPGLAGHLGIVKTKANLFLAAADWPAYMGLLSQTTAADGILWFAFVTSWVFGREYTDHTVKDLLALPVSRITIVLSKFIILVVWCLLLSALIIISGLITGFAISLPNFSLNLLYSGLGKIMVSAVLAIILITPVAFLASVGKGYLLPLGFTASVFIVIQVTNMLGWAAFFPWAIPVLYITPSEHLGAVSYIILLLTGIAGTILTLAWWQYADQSGS
ncbi:bacitracin ABC transporter permease [Candidatus Desantisbacteria bacterium CG_4_10_14_0_8_um_filter_48_22]|uniref:Bacitracin ABC transporter permease n=1 Tax=Candidatus Desantisbacteria bacterium CG_4_10_14_0_8_um_filter_48_22 TaxID=1974543 RepID=A0A2M7S7I8_9BACT|nr:MAG: bacitracin ABC transporter permease [Candidatus Desantisbacteria bacterium CG02_land_8_20_14_3_00_49_13]PIZ15323.1 MAG: bacitracin ABC transporter permease [Candidatus Desantisbacteria bacterium CG_4_10_14_0_8_um_filter_48_22]